MDLPSATALEDAALQLEYAAAQLGPLLEMLTIRCDAPPDNPAQRPRWEQNTALLRALKAYCGAVTNAQGLHDQQVSEMRKEMGSAQFRYNQMGVERDYLRAELQEMNTRYYAALDTFHVFQNALMQRLHGQAA